MCLTQTNMQLTKNFKVFNIRKVEETLKIENKFISDLFSVLLLPIRNGNYKIIV